MPKSTTAAAPTTGTATALASPDTRVREPARGPRRARAVPLAARSTAPARRCPPPGRHRQRSQ